ncbi:MAG: ribosome assembly RNA-binding protein YhbY [Oscillospiraceae bacterium]|nr:ribosome assembly RNA-binding protein YhbY [Oscillospiraceae bacterium]
MELTSKQRAQLRALANPLEPIVHIGKGDLGDNLIRQTDDALEARELIKCRVLETSEYSPREAAEALAKATRSEVVQVIGTKFILYRQSHKKEKKDKILLVRR